MPTVRLRIRSAIRNSTILVMPAAVSSTLRPRRSATGRIAASDAARSSWTSPPRKYCGSIRPRMTLASVTVGSVPPRP